MASRPEPRSAHPYYMYEAIYGQPAAIQRVLTEEGEAVHTLAQSIARAERVHLVGIGTSWHAALVGEFLLRTVGGREESRAWNSFEFCTYPPTLGPQDMVIVMSHTGIKHYSATALELVKTQGAQIAFVTSLGSEGKMELADVVIRTSERDKSAAYTISHTTALTALAMVAAAVGTQAGRPEAQALQHGLANLPQLVTTALEQESRIQHWARLATYMHWFYFVGWGPNTSTAYEVALKIKETSYLRTEGFQIEQYLHGPYVATNPGGMVTFIAPPGRGQERAHHLLEAVREVGAHTVVIVQRGDQIASLADLAVYMPETPEPLTPIVFLVPLQLFTYWLALELKRNPDTFRLDDPSHRAAREKYRL